MLLLLLLFVLAAVPAVAQEPRLPPPAYPGATLESLDAQLPAFAEASAGKNLRPADAVPLDAAILRARLLSRAGRFKESAAGWSDVGTREPLLLSLSRGEAIRALLDGGELQAALDGIAQLGATAPADILLRAAAACGAVGMLEPATSLYTQARASAGRSPLGDQAALGLAATLERAGNLPDALDLYREIQLTFRQPSAYDAADAAARRLSARLGGSRPPAPLTEDDYDLISDRLTNAAAFRRSIDVLKEWRASFPNTTRAAGIDYAILQNLYSLRANDEAREMAAAIIKKNGAGPEAAAATRTLVSLDVREGRSADVERRGFAILGGQVTGITLDQRLSVGRQLGEYLLSTGQITRAMGAFDQVYRLTKRRSDRIDLSWRMAITALRAGNRARAITLLRQVRTLKLDSETDRATSYWLAYALDGGGAPTEARQIWNALVRRYPYSYYGARAASKLGLPDPQPSLILPPLELSAAVMAHPDYRTASLLSRAGLLTDAAFYARRLSGTFRRDPAVALLAARASEAADEPSATATLMSSFFGDYLERPSTGLPEDFWRLAYPRAYWTDVVTAAARHHVDPLLMIALSRQESHFERTIKSPVGAIGLFQIMPYTAVELDPSFRIDTADEQLVKPDVSAELAARLLEQNLQRFGGALAPAIASYNADRERVLVWWDNTKALPEEMFVDSIPYLQTRAYVRQVLANYGMYQRFGGPPASP
ncbi:MAG TPA: lytic transglycosylase domain-containing protein [Vicinamibacterales bacterium]|nr:lytic transglycosylase domain-containing protein [Vicinamibacterales bacterium]